MTSSEAPGTDDGASRVGSLPFDVTKAHQARSYDYLLGGKDNFAADLRDTGTILAQAANLLDFTKPVAVTLLSILHAITDADDPYSIVATLLDAVPSGSYLAISHAGPESFTAEARENLMDSTRRTSLQQYTLRTREQVARFFDGTDLVEPGLVPVEEWRPDPGVAAEGKSVYWCAVGQKR